MRTEGNHHCWKLAFCAMVGAPEARRALPSLLPAQVRAVARTGGMIGIGYWDQATCGKTVQDIAKSIAYAVKCVLSPVFLF